MAFQILPFLATFLGLISNLIFSIIIAQVLYYVARPIRDFLEEKNVPRTIAIILIFILLFICFALVVMFIWPFLSQQINEFTATPKEKIKEVEEKTIDFLNSFNFTSLNERQLQETIIFYGKQLMQYILNNITFALSSIAHIASYFIVTPFLLFYLLKEDYGMFSGAIDIFPISKRKNIKKISENVDKTLAQYINGQVLVACIVGFLIGVGYTIIGLNYAFALAFLAFVFNLIPFCGPFISTIPALLIGISHSPFMAFKVLLVVSTVHLLDLNLISPRIVGYTLNVHPTTIILLLVLGFSLGGFLGLFVITPLYAVCKSIARDVVEIKETSEKVDG